MSTKGEAKPKLWRRYASMPRNVIALSAVSLLNDTSSEIIYPLLPAFLALALGASPFAIGLIEGFAESVASILKLFAGYFSDRFGTRKAPVLIGYALAAVSRPFLGFATNWEQVLALRGVDRIGKGVRGAPRDAMIADAVPVSQRGFAYGFNRAADHMGAVLGPVISFVLLSVIAVNASEPSIAEYQWVFLVASIPVVLSLLVIIFFVRETREHSADVDKPKLSFRGFDRNFRFYLLVIAVFTLSNSSDAFLLLRAKDAGIPAAMIPLLWGMLHVSKVIFSVIGGSMSDRIGRKTLIMSGWLVYALVYAGFAFVGSAWQCWTLFLIYGVYFGLTEGVEKAFVADMVPAKLRGTAFGMYNLAFGITVFPASLLFGLAWSQFGAVTAFLASACVSVAAMILLSTLKAPKMHHST
jgi:MFS family permease